jgi:hypothetical protein
VTIPAPDRDPEYRRELLGYYQEAMDRHPRGRQQMLGPSEIGGCLRKAAFKMKYGVGDGKGQGWAAHKGVQLHKWADEEVFAKLPRFLSDLSLDQVVPWVAGGTLDLYDTERKIVIDFKFPGDPSITKARRGKPPEDYYVQINQYALGLLRMGYPVERVALFYAPMCGDDLHGEAKGAVLLTWPLDLKAALDAIRDIKRTQDLVDTKSFHEVMQLLQTKDSFCHGCPNWTGNRDPRALCGGHRKSGASVRDPNDIFG